MNMDLSALVVVGLLVIYVTTAGIRFGHMSLISLFVYAQAVMALGTIWELSESHAADTVHAWLILATFAVLIGVSALLSFAPSLNTRRDYSPTVDFSYPVRTVAFWLVASMAITVAYYAALGYLPLFESLGALVVGEEQDLAGLRLEAYAGSRYLYPGYVNQFKNALLPALVLVVSLGLFRTDSRGRYLSSALLIAAASTALLGTGQRGAFVTMAVIVAVAFAYIAPKRFPSLLPRLAIPVLLLFFLSTYASGRARSELEQADGFIGVLRVFVDQLLFRLTGSNQLSSAVGFRYVYQLEPIPLGSEWIESFVGLLPGQPGSDLSNRIFEVLYGSTRGTAPLSVWGSAYHNVGFAGALAYAALLAVSLCVFSARLNRVTHANTLELVGAAGVTGLVGTWIADGPVTLLNGGLVIYLCLLAWGHERRRQNDPLRSRSLRTQSHRLPGRS